MRTISYFDAVFEAEREEMARDERVLLIGEDLAIYQAMGLLGNFAAKRIRSAPISENSFVGVAVGAAMTGLRPIVDLTIASFVYLAMDQLANQAAKCRYMFGGQAHVPLVVRAAMWHASSHAAHHSDRPYPMLMNVPGIKVVVPTTPYDMKGLLKAAVRDEDPVIVFEDHGLWFEQGGVPDEDYVVPLGIADIKREGCDVTVVAVGSALSSALQAAEELGGEGISVEVVDPRSLVPLDKRTILQSIGKTGRLVIAEPAHKTNGAGAEIAAIVAEEAFDSLQAPIRRVATPDCPIPFSPALEQSLYPNKDKIIAAVRHQLG